MAALDERPADVWLRVAHADWTGNVVSFGLWASPLGRYAANRGAPSSFGVPVFGILAGMVMLDETATFWQWIGGALVNAYIKAMLRQIDRPVAKVHLDFHILIK